MDGGKEMNVKEKEATRKALNRIFEECGIFSGHAIVIPAYSTPGIKSKEIATFPSSEHHPEPTKELWNVFRKFFKEELAKIP